MIFNVKNPTEWYFGEKKVRWGEISNPQQKSLIDMGFTRPQLKADRGQSIRKHNIRHFFLKMKISDLARKISE